MTVNLAPFERAPWGWGAPAHLPLGDTELWGDGLHGLQALRKVMPSGESKVSSGKAVERTFTARLTRRPVYKQDRTQQSCPLSGD